MIAVRRCRLRLLCRSSRLISLRRQRRAEALAHLISLLEASSPEPLRPSRPATDGLPGRQSQLARLRAAHAAYALSTGLMQRTGTGAWMRTRRDEGVIE